MTAWNLVEFGKIETDVLRKSVIDGLAMESSPLELIPWETIGALSTRVIRYKDLPTIGFRKINEGYSASIGHLEDKTENISLMGVLIDTDKAIARAKNTIADARALQQNMALKGVAYKFSDKFINGDPKTDPEEFKGVKERIDDLVKAGYADQKINNNGTAGDGILLDTTERNNFLNKLDALIYAIKGHNPDALFMNKKMLLALRAVLRQEKLLNQAQDQYGRTIDMYGNTRLYDLGCKADQITEIITNTETTAGASGGTECTSIYAVKFGVGEFLWGIQEYPIEVDDVGLLTATPTIYRTQVDWPVGMADVDPRCIARLYNIIPDSST